MSSIYAESTTFFEQLLETTQYLDKCKTDKTISKEDVVESMENRLCMLIGKLISVPTSTSFALFKSNKDAS
jgi:hypothetical protein